MFLFLVPFPCSDVVYHGNPSYRIKFKCISKLQIVYMLRLELVCLINLKHSISLHFVNINNIASAVPMPIYLITKRREESISVCEEYGIMLLWSDGKQLPKKYLISSDWVHIKSMRALFLSYLLLLNDLINEIKETTNVQFNMSSIDCVQFESGNSLEIESFDVSTICCELWSLFITPAISIFCLIFIQTQTSDSKSTASFSLFPYCFWFYY